MQANKRFTESYGSEKQKEKDGSFAGLWVRTARVLRSGGYVDRDSVREAVLIGKLRPYISIRNYGRRLHEEVVSWLGPTLSPQLPPVSTSFMEFVRPEMPEALPSDERRYVVHLMAWNLAILPSDSAAARMTRAGLLEFPPELRKQMTQFLNGLIERKRRLFPDDLRVIAECHLVRDQGEEKLRAVWSELAHISARL